MNRQPPIDDEFEADVAAMLARRAHDVDVVAATRLGATTTSGERAGRNRAWRPLALGIAAACLIVVTGFVAFTAYRSDRSVTVASQPDASVEPIPVEGTGIDVTDECDPPDPTTAAIPAICRTTATTHTVAIGDRLGSIAATYGVTIDAILRANPDMDPSVIIAGDELVIPPATVPRSTASLCPLGYPIARDTDGDGEIDTCFASDAMEAATGQDVPPTITEDPPPEDWLNNEIGIDPPIRLELWDMAVATSRYSGLVSQAQASLNVSCMNQAGFAFPDIDLFAERSPSRDSFDFELAPFAYDGGYALANNRANSNSSIGPTANALLAEQSQYVEALSLVDQESYRISLQGCQTRARTIIFDGETSHDRFVELINIGLNLPVTTMGLVDEHPVAQAAQQRWRDCMATEGHDIDSRSSLVQAAAEERMAIPGGGPGPTEAAVSSADRACSAKTGYSRHRAAALHSAEQYLLAHDATIAEFAADWQVVLRDLRPRLVELVGADLVEEYTVSAYVARGVPLATSLPTKAQFEEAFVEEIVFCATARGWNEAEVRKSIDNGELNGWLHRTIEQNRATVEQVGSQVLALRLSHSPVTPNSPYEPCAQDALLLVSPKQRAEVEPGFNGRFAEEVERYGIQSQLDAEWRLCMQTAGHHEFASVGDLHQQSFDLAERVATGELTETEALTIDQVSFGAHFECMLTIDYAERWRLFSEQIGAELFVNED